MAPPRKRQKTSNMVNKDTNTGPTRPSGDRPVRHTKSRFSRPRQPSANTSVNNDIIDENSQNDQSNTALNIDYAKLAAEILRQQNSNLSVQLDTRDNVADNRNDSVTQSPYSAVQNSQQTHTLATENRQNDTVSAQLLPPLSTLPLNGEHAINDVNSSSLTNIPVHQSPASTVQPSSSVQNNMYSLIDQLLMSQPVSLNSGTQSQFGRITDLSGGIPLGAHVPQKTKDKIWADDYIDLRSLLSTEVESDPWSITLAPSTIALQSNHSNSQHKKPPLSFHEWTEAFHIYTAIYVQKFPQEAPNMLKYMSTIRELYDLKNIYAVHYYDETFRLLRKSNHQHWQMPIRELHDKALYKKRPNQFQTHPTRNNNYSNRTEQPFLGPRDGTCHIYNKYQSCNRKNCIFQHVCKSCRGPHPQIICPRSNKYQHNTTNNKQTPKPQHTPQPGKK